MVASCMLTSLALTIIFLGCRGVTAPEVAQLRQAEVELPSLLVVPGAPDHCRASWVFEGPIPVGAQPEDPFRQVPGVLEGAAFGACTLMGPTHEGGWLWVLMSFEPGFRGALRCVIDELRSPALQVGPVDLVAPEGMKIKILLMDPAQAAARIIPMESIPCPALAEPEPQPEP